LAILLPSIFQIAKSVLLSIAENIFTASSGVEVQKATIVSQITIAGILNLSAIELAHDTSISAHFIKITKPITNSM
jgi:hypothetical protein